MVSGDDRRALGSTEGNTAGLSSAVQGVDLVLALPSQPDTVACVLCALPPLAAWRSGLLYISEPVLALAELTDLRVDWPSRAVYAAQRPVGRQALPGVKRHSFTVVRGAG